MKFDAAWFSDLVCPVDKSRLRFENDRLISGVGRVYPVVDGIPVMLVADIEQTIDAAYQSISAAVQGQSDPPLAGYFVESLGLSDEERSALAKVIRTRSAGIDPVVSFMVAATNGNAYQSMSSVLDNYPIPEIRLPEGQGRRLIDLGCNWGRWSIAAARRGYVVTGIDPQLGAVMAARRVTRDLGLSIRFVVADARYLPFAERSFDQAFSYSVLQHLSKTNAGLALAEVSRVLELQGESLIQMPNWFGIRSLWHQARRGFRDGRGFDVRYWSLGELRERFEALIGPSNLSVDCFFGLGLQPADRRFYRTPARLALDVSEVLRGWSRFLPLLVSVADSVYVHSKKIR